MRVALYAIRVKGGCVLWVRYPKDGNDVTKTQRNLVILSSVRDLPEDDPDKAEYRKFIRETIAQIRAIGFNLLNAKDFVSEEKAAKPELEAV